MIVVYYLDCAPIFFLLFVYYLEYHSSLLRSLPVTPESPELPSPSGLVLGDFPPSSPAIRITLLYLWYRACVFCD